MYKKVINFLINTFKFIYLPIILPFRNKARVVVYNYFIKNNINYMFHGKKLELKDNKYYLDNKYFIVYLDNSKYIYYLYFNLVWIWLDDETVDNINLEKIITNKYLKVIFKEDINSILKSNINKAFKNPNYNFEVNDYLLLFYISMFYNNNNYYNYKYYSNIKTKLHNKLVFKNDYPVYTL